MRDDSGSHSERIDLQLSHPNPFHIESHLSAAVDVLCEIQLQTLLAPAQPQSCITLHKHLLLKGCRTSC